MTPCPICELADANEKPTNRDSQQYRCIRCGDYELSGTAMAMLWRGLADNHRGRAVLSHAVRKMQGVGKLPMIMSSLYEQILNANLLPKPAEQATNLLLWLGDAANESFKGVTIAQEALQAIIGSADLDSVGYIAYHLRERNLISFDRTNTVQAYSPLKFVMKFEGWEEFDRLKTVSVESRTAFMAMKFGDAELNKVVENVFRPAVAAAGFELRVLTDAPRAGLIDDRLRVEIRRARFLIADITHQNLGAYWEAGFAEGLGKPVIYTCKKDAFEKGASHFDTNHHLTVMWHSDAELVAEDLKATIRATFPTDAKLTD
jgi:hypothetical protein